MVAIDKIFPVSAVTCDSKPLTTSAILFLSKSSVCVFLLVLLVGLFPLVPDVLPALAGPVWRLAVKR